MIHLLDSVEYYHHRAQDIVEQAMVCNSRPLKKEESRTLNNFVKLSSGDKMLELLHLMKDLLPEFIIKLQGTREAQVAILQQFQAAEMKDIFEELSRKELLEILKHDQQFRQRFVRFAKITLRHEQEQGEVIDLLNNKNVTLITEKNRHRLLVLDPHGVYDSRKGYKAESKTRLRLRYLEELLQEIDKM